MSANAPTEITFSDAYEELKRITARLNNEEVEADELVQLLRRGKGLEAVLREHLSTVEQEVTAIESGEDVTSFQIVPEKQEAALKPPAETSDLDFSSPGSPAPTGDDIPF